MDKWSPSLANLTGPRTEFCALVLDQILFVIGGINGQGDNFDVQGLELNSMKWASFPSMKIGRSSFACAKFGNNLLVAGGRGQIQSQAKVETLAAVEYLDLHLKQWKDLTPMNQARADFAMISHHDEQREIITAFGGFHRQHPLDSIENLRPDKSLEFVPSAFKLRQPVSNFALVAVPDNFASFANCGKLKNS